MDRKIVIACLLMVGHLGAQERALTLTECVQLALQKNPQIHRQQLDVEAAKTGLQLAKSYNLPQVSLSSSLSHSTQGPSEYVFNNITFTKGDTTTNYYTAGLSVSQTLYHGGKIRNAVKLANTNYQMKEKSYHYLRQQITADVTEKFYTLLKQQELLKVYRAAQQNSQEQLKKTEEMYRLGQVAKKDLYKAQVREGNDRLNVIRQEAQVKIALDDLKKALGVASDYPLSVREEGYLKPQIIPREEAIRQTLTNNPNLKILNLEQESARLNYLVARGEMMPSLDAYYGYRREGSELNRIYSRLDKWWNTSLQISLSYPLFQGLYRKANIQQKYLQYQGYKDQIAQQQLELITAIDKLLTTLRTYLEMIEINELNIASAEEDLRLQQEMYRLNSATLLEVLDAQVALTRAQGDLISVKYDAKIAEVQLALLMGNL